MQIETLREVVESTVTMSRKTANEAITIADKYITMANADHKRIDALQKLIEKLTARVEEIETSRLQDSVVWSEVPASHDVTMEISTMELAAELYAIRHECDAVNFRDIPASAESLYLEAAKKLLEKFYVLTKEAKKQNA